jgi:hypothetical protein
MRGMSTPPHNRGGAEDGGVENNQRTPVSYDSDHQRLPLRASAHHLRNASDTKILTPQFPATFAIRPLRALEVGIVPTEKSYKGPHLERQSPVHCPAFLVLLDLSFHEQCTFHGAGEATENLLCHERITVIDESRKEVTKVVKQEPLENTIR